MQSCCISWNGVREAVQTMENTAFLAPRGRLWHPTPCPVGQEICPTYAFSSKITSGFTFQSIKTNVPRRQSHFWVRIDHASRVESILPCMIQVNAGIRRIGFPYIDRAGSVVCKKSAQTIGRTRGVNHRFLTRFPDRWQPARREYPVPDRRNVSPIASGHPPYRYRSRKVFPDRRRQSAARKAPARRHSDRYE